MCIVYLGIGSNIGDREDNFKKAIVLLRQEDIDIVSISSFYLTKPSGGPPQEDYLNGVLKIKTKFTPNGLLKKLKQIETDMGRKKAELNGPRIIDLDILLFNDEILNGQYLTIPHPRMHKRAFVLKGFAEIEPDLVHPLENRTIEELLAFAEKKNDNDQ